MVATTLAPCSDGTHWPLVVFALRAVVHLQLCLSLFPPYSELSSTTALIVIGVEVRRYRAELSYPAHSLFAGCLRNHRFSALRAAY